MRFGLGSKRQSIKAQAVERKHGLPEGLGREAIEDEAGPARNHRLRPSAFGEDHRRPAAGHGLQGNDAEVLDPGHDHRPAATVEGAEALVVDLAQELRLPGGEGAEPVLLGAAAHHLEPPARSPEGVHDQVEALVGSESRDHEVVLALDVGTGGEEVRVDEGRDDLGLPAVVAADARRHVTAVGGEMVHPWCRGHVPGAKPFGDDGHREPGEAPQAAGAEVVVVAVPDIAHGGVAIAEVQRSRRRLHALGHAMRAADHEVEAREVDRRGRGREERQVAPVAAVHLGQPLHEGGVDLPRLELGCDRPLHVEQGEDGRVWKEASQGEKDLLTAPHSREPVVDEGDPGQREGSAASAVAGCPSAFM